MSNLRRRIPLKEGLEHVQSVTGNPFKGLCSLVRKLRSGRLIAMGTKFDHAEDWIEYNATEPPGIIENIPKSLWRVREVDWSNSSLGCGGEYETRMAGCYYLDIKVFNHEIAAIWGPKQVRSADGDGSKHDWHHASGAMAEFLLEKGCFPNTQEELVRFLSQWFKRYGDAKPPHKTQIQKNLRKVYAGRKMKL